MVPVLKVHEKVCKKHQRGIARKNKVGRKYDQVYVMRKVCKMIYLKFSYVSGRMFWLEPFPTSPTRAGESRIRNLPYLFLATRTAGFSVTFINKRYYAQSIDVDVCSC